MSELCAYESRDIKKILIPNMIMCLQYSMSLIFLLQPLIEKPTINVNVNMKTFVLFRNS